MTDPDERFADIAAALDRYADVPDDTLLEIVTSDGACMYLHAHDETPSFTGDDLTDRELATQVCASCLVCSECLELELRTAGPFTVGVWGAIPEDHRKEIYPLWAVRRQPFANPDEDQDGGER